MCLEQHFHGPDVYGGNRLTGGGQDGLLQLYARIVRAKNLAREGHWDNNGQRTR